MTKDDVYESEDYERLRTEMRRCHREIEHQNRRLLLARVDAKEYEDPNIPTLTCMRPSLERDIARLPRANDMVQHHLKNIELKIYGKPGDLIYKRLRRRERRRRVRLKPIASSRGETVVVVDKSRVPSSSTIEQSQRTCRHRHHRRSPKQQSRNRRPPQQRTERLEELRRNALERRAAAPYYINARTEEAVWEIPSGGTATSALTTKPRKLMSKLKNFFKRGRATEGATNDEKVPSAEIDPTSEDATAAAWGTEGDQELATDENGYYAYDEGGYYA